MKGSDMIKSYLAEAGLVTIFCICAGLVLLAGCGDEAGPSGTGGEGIAAPPGGRKAPGPKNQAPAKTTKLLVTLEDRSDRKPIPSARMTLMVQTDRNPESLTVRDIWTDSTGVAEENIEDAYRAAVMSEYCAAPREIPLSEDEAAITLTVTTGYELSGRVVSAGPGNGPAAPLENAAVMIYGLRRGKDRAAAAPPPLPDTMGGAEAFKKRFFHDLVAECRTDGEGRFECRVDGLRPLVATADADGFIAADWRHLSIDPLAGDGADGISYGPLEIALRPEAFLVIRFLDPRGRAIKGHEAMVRESPFSVHLRQYRERIMVPFSAVAKADADGLARIAVPAGMEIVVDSRKKESFIPLFDDDGIERDLMRQRPLDRVAVAAGQTRALIAMPQGNVRIECTVVDAGGSPVEGATLSLPRQVSRTDAQGRTAVILPASRVWDAPYRVTREGFGVAEDFLPPSVSEGKRLIELNVEIRRSTPLMIAAHPQARKVWLVKKEGIRLSGRVKAGGEDLPPEEVLAPPTRLLDRGWLFDNPGTAECALLVQTGPFSFHRVGAVTAAAGGIDLEPPPRTDGVLLDGTVVLPRGARPQSVAVTVMRNDIPQVRRFDPFGKRGQFAGWRRKDAVSKGGADSPEWTFRFEGLVPGRYALSASLLEWGQRTDLYGEIVVDPAATQAAVTLEPRPERGSLEITVVDRDGQGIPDVDCLLLDPVDEPIASSTAMGIHFVTDASGVIVMKDMIPGRYGFVISGRALPGVPVNGRVLVEGKTESRVTVAIE